MTGDFASLKGVVDKISKEISDDRLAFTIEKFKSIY